MKKNDKMNEDDPLPEYDFKGGERGKYAARYALDTHRVVLAPDVAQVFPDSQSVNRALRTLIRIAKETAGPSQSRPAR